MAVVATQQIGLAGTATTYSAASGGGDEFRPESNVFIRVKNASGGAITCTIVTPQTGVGGAAIGDIAVSVPATTGERDIGPFPPEHFAAADGNADVTWSSATSVTFAVLRL